MSRLAEAAGSWRVALRLARRSARRNPARTALITLMLALPVYAGTVLALSYAGTYSSPENEMSWVLGRADLRVTGVDDPARLPAGSSSVAVRHGRTVVRVGQRHTLSRYEATDLDAPLNSGRYALRAGRAARDAAEVAVTGRLADRLDLRIGQTLPVGTPPRDRTITGIVDLATELSVEAVILPAGAAPSAGGAEYLLVDLPAGGGWRPEGNGVGHMVRDAGRYRAQQAGRVAALVLVLGFAGTQVALLAGAAFAVGAQRRRRELAMVGAVGARRAQVARLVLAEGLLLGAVAGAAGVGLGALTYRLSRSTVERIANHPLAEGGAPPWWLAGIALFAVAAGLLAALGPARGAARQAIRAALAGRETTRPAANLRWLTAGLLTAAAGAATATLASGATGSVVTVAVGTVAVLLGVAACAPVIVSLLGRIAGRLPLASRLAVRHAARHRLRTAASVAAVCAAIAGSTAVMLYGSADVQTGQLRQPTARTGQVLLPPSLAAHLDPDGLRAVAAELPARSVAPVSEVDSYAAGTRLDEAQTYGASGLPAFPSTQVAVGGTALIGAVTGTTPGPAVDRAVVFYPELLDAGGHLTLHPTGGGKPVTLPAMLVRAPDYYRFLPGAVIPPELAARHRLATRPAGAVIDTTRAPTPAEVTAAESRMLALTADAPGEPAGLTVGAPPSRGGRDFGAMFAVLAAVSALVTVAAGAVAVGLATSELRTDLGTLAAVGAGPRLRRRIAAAQAGLIVGVGALLGTLAGIAPAAALVAFRDDLAWSVPWAPLIGTILVAPVLAVVATALFTRPHLTLTRRPAF